MEHGETLRIGRQEVKITHPHKVLFPEDGMNKGELIHYYRRVARWMVPFVRQRPLSLQRYPAGIGEPGFFQQRVSPYFPEWLDRVTLPKEGGTVTHAMANNAAALVYLANQAMVTPHVWLSRADRLDQPDQMAFDLDPSGADFTTVKDAARCLRELLDGLKLPAYLKTTGGSGLHVVVPLDRRADFDSVRAFARRLAQTAVARAPDRWTLEQRKDKRRGRVYIDVHRNAYGQTMAPAYAVRAGRGAPVSVPIAWEELEGLKASDHWTIRSVFGKLESCDDPWKNFFKRPASLERAKTKLEELDATGGVPQETEVRRNAGTRRRAA